MRKQQQGFTLIEIAIVLVIIGLLLGGVLKGQELIQNARVRNIISQQDGIKAAYFGFQDRYRGIPGDYPDKLAQQNIPGMTSALCAAGNACGGDQSGLIDKPTEAIIAWLHLSKAGFITGSYDTDGTETSATPANTPANPFGGFMQLIYDASYYPSGTGAVSNPKITNIKTGKNIPSTILAEVDRKIDDGSPITGSFRFSTFDTASTSCVTSGNNWDVSGGQTVCGGASLF